MNKKTVLFVIDNLGKGGAETLLIGLLPELHLLFDVVIVTLSDEYEFEPSQLVCGQRLSLGFTGKWSFVATIKKLKKIIEQTEPVLVHAHLLNSSIVARVACPSNIPLVYSLHTILSKDAFDKSLLYTWLERVTVKARHHVIAVSQAALDDYRKIISSPGQSFVLNNYVADSFITSESPLPKTPTGRPLKLLSVGNLKAVKNYHYLVQAFEYLKDLPVTIDIYGQGEPQTVSAFQKEIYSKNLSIVLKGRADQIAELLPLYDLFVMPSRYEGFGIAPIEAMAVGLPLLLSDIPVFRDITYGNALFFNLDDPKSFASLITDIINNQYDLELLSERGISIVKENYTKAIYLQKLLEIYGQLQPKLAE